MANQDQRALASALRPMMRRISMMLSRGTLVLANTAAKMQRLQVRLLAGEVKGDVEHFEAYGFTSAPKAGAEALAVFFDGDRSHGVVICVADRRYRMTGLADGEVAIYNSANANPSGCHVWLKADGSIEVRGNNIDMKAAGNLRLAGDTVKIHAATSFAFDCNGQGQKWNGTSVETWQDNDVAGAHHNHAPPETP